MTSISVLVGIQASGKTTFARKFCKEKGAKRINKDELRLMVDDMQFCIENEHLIRKILNQILLLFLNEGIERIILDNTHLHITEINSIEEIVKPYNVDINFILFDIPLEVCLERNSLRKNNFVPEEVIRRFYEKYKEIKAFLFEKYPTKTRIFNIDNKKIDTLSTNITFFGKQRTISCDARCDKAWGKNWGYEKEYPAPIDTGIYEGGEAKPKNKKHNKWCARECERSNII